jgi:hypothetical protein
MTTTYKLRANELSIDIIDSIKLAFPDKDIEITVTDSVLLDKKANGIVAYTSSGKSLNAQEYKVSIEESIEQYRLGKVIGQKEMEIKS